MILQNAFVDNAPDSDTPAYELLRRQIALFHAEVGADRFELHFGLREPKDELEHMEVLFRQQKISVQDFTARLQAFAERRVDATLSTGRLSG